MYIIINIFYLIYINYYFLVLKDIYIYIYVFFIYIINFKYVYIYFLMTLF